MAYTIKTTKAFDKDMERCIKRGYPMEELRKAMKLLEREQMRNQYRAAFFIKPNTETHGRTIQHLHNRP